MKPATSTSPGLLRQLFLRALVPFYRQMTRKPLRLAKRFTPAGWMLLGLAGITGLMGVDTARTQLYQFFAICASLLLVALMSTLLFRPRLQVRRRLPSHGAVGQTLHYNIEVSNLRSRTERDIALIEIIPSGRPSAAAFIHEREPGEDTRNIFDRTFVFYRWRWLVDRNKHLDPLASELTDLAPEASVHLQMKCTPRRRGKMELTSMGALQADIFGLVRTLRRIPNCETDSVIILPKRYPIPRLRMEGRNEYQPAGSAISRSRGQSEEFVALRDYRPGDPLRHIHWRSWARLRKPVIKEYVEEYIPRYALILDTFALADPSDAFEDAVSVAASFTCELESSESLLDLMFVGTESYHLTTGRGRNEAARLLDVLASVELNRTGSFDDLSEHVLGFTRDLSACVCILLSASAERQEFIRRLNTLGIPTLCLVVAAGEDALPGGWHRLTPGRIPAGLAKLGPMPAAGRKQA